MLLLMNRALFVSINFFFWDNEGIPEVFYAIGLIPQGLHHLAHTASLLKSEAGRSRRQDVGSKPTPHLNHCATLEQYKTRSCSLVGRPHGHNHEGCGFESHYHLKTMKQYRIVIIDSSINIKDMYIKRIVKLDM